MTRIFNFAAGPSAMPLPVLEQAASEMTDWHGVGYSILEMSHRSKEFMGIYRETVEMLRELYGIPEEYEVMFVQGGGHLHRRSARLPKLPALNSEPLVRTNSQSPTALLICITAPTKRSTAFVTGIARKSMFP